jgi:hypothetical protein
MRPRSCLTAAAIVAVVVAFLGLKRFGRSDGPEDVWRRAHKAMIDGDYGTVYDCLSVEAKRDADAMFLTVLAKDADRTTDSAEAAWLRSLRGREAYIEGCHRTDRSVPQVGWTDIVRCEVHSDRARLTVRRPPVAAPTEGTVDMVHENGEWKVVPMVR